MDCDIIEMLPTTAEYNHLRASVGWGTYEPVLIEAAMPHSLFCICAVLNERVIGMARVIGDGGLVYYVQDVIVLPEHQGQGIGTRLMDAIMAYLHTHTSPNSVIGLMAAKGKEPFYDKYGCITRPNDQMSCGMTTNHNTIQSHLS